MTALIIRLSLALLLALAAGPGAALACSSAAECDDGNDCTTDTCDPIDGCLHTPNVTCTPRVDVPSGTTWGTLHRLLALQRSRKALSEIEMLTDDLIRDVDATMQATQNGVRPVVVRLRALAADPAPDGESLADGAQEFRGLVDRAKGLVDDGSPFARGKLPP